MQKQMKKDKYINGYRLQYWMYAVLNKEFGSEVKFTRDSMHKQYSVSRHGFSVSTNTVSLDTVYSFLTKKLKECDYKLPEKSGVSSLDFEKVTKKETGVESLYVCVQKNKLAHSKAQLSISLHTYWKNLQ